MPGGPPRGVFYGAGGAVRLGPPPPPWPGTPQSGACWTALSSSWRHPPLASSPPPPPCAASPPGGGGGHGGIWGQAGGHTGVPPLPAVSPSPAHRQPRLPLPLLLRPAPQLLVTLGPTTFLGYPCHPWGPTATHCAPHRHPRGGGGRTHRPTGVPQTPTATLRDPQGPPDPHGDPPRTHNPLHQGHQLVLLPAPLLEVGVDEGLQLQQVLLHPLAVDVLGGGHPRRGGGIWSSLGTPTPALTHSHPQGPP